MFDVDALTDVLGPPKGRCEVAVVREDARMHIAGSSGSALFEAGSLTKTFTATVLASLIVDGSISLDTTVRAILGADAGAAGGLTMRQLATHTSGLPRLAPNAVTIPFWPRDPYRFYRKRHLMRGLRRVSLDTSTSPSYSNFGYQLLGECLERVTGDSLAALLSDRVFKPLEMTTARCQPCSGSGLQRGHGPLLVGGRRWNQPLPGAGGVDCSIEDLAKWLAANCHPSGELRSALTLAQATDPVARLPLSWQRRGDVIWHNGATGGFQAVCAFIPRQLGVAVLASCAPSQTYAADTIVLTALADATRT